MVARLFGLLALCGTVAMLPTSIDAAGCRRVVSTRVVRAPYVAPYVAPVYNAAVVQQVVAVPVVADYYYSLGSHYQSQLIADAVVGRLSILLAQQNQAQPKPGSFKPAVEPAPSGAKASAVPANQQLTALVQAKCLRCHGPQKKEGGFDMSNLDGIPAARRWECVGRAASEDMPRAGGPLTDQELALFSEWAGGTK